MLLFAEYDLVSTSLIHAAVVQSSDIFDKTRMHSITTKKKINKQTAERPIHHIDSYPSAGLDRNSVDIGELYSKISFLAVHTNI